jgi:hypothetical protein
MQLIHPADVTFLFPLMLNDFIDIFVVRADTIAIAPSLLKPMLLRSSSSIAKDFKPEESAWHPSVVISH